MKPIKTVAEQKEANEAKRQEKRAAAAAALSERRKRAKLFGSENMSRWLSAGARGTAECRDPRGAPVRTRQHAGAVPPTNVENATYRGQQGLGESGDVIPTVYGLAGVLDVKEVQATPGRPILKRYRGQGSSPAPASSASAPGRAAGRARRCAGCRASRA